MCNLYRLKVRRWELLERYGAMDVARREADREEMEKDYVSPGREGWVVTRDDDGRRVEKMRWGFPNPRGGKDVVNVRNYASPMWRPSLVDPARRCLVPFAAFQEWTVDPDPVTGRKRAHWFDLPANPLGAFAGVWRPTPEGPRYAFLTCGYDGDPSVHVVGSIHPKAIPVILHDEDHDRWLGAPVEDALTLACAHPSQLLRVDG